MSAGIEEVVKTDPASDQQDDPYEIPAFLRRPKVAPVAEAQAFGGDREDLTGGLARPPELPPTEVVGETANSIAMVGSDIGNDALGNTCGSDTGTSADDIDNEAIIKGCDSDTCMDGIGTSPGEDAGAGAGRGSVLPIEKSGASDPHGENGLGDEARPSSTDGEEPAQNNESQKPATGGPILPVPEGVEVIIPPHRLGKPVATWDYRDEDGRLLFLTARFNYVRDGKPKKDVIPLSYCGSARTGHCAWKWKGSPAPRSLFGLDRLAARPNAPVIVVEGEKKCEPAERLFPDYVAVTSMGGAGNAGYSDWSPLKDRDVRIWPDADQAGCDYADDVKRLALEAGAREVSVVQIPTSFTDGWDLADPLPPGVAVEDLRKMLDEAAAAPGELLSDHPVEHETATEGKAKISTILLKIAEDAQLFRRADDGKAFADILVAGIRQTYPVRSAGFKAWLRRRYFEMRKAAPNAEAMQEALGTIEARAEFDSGVPSRPVFIRVGEHEGRLYLDLADDQWRAVEIDTTRWRVVQDPPVRFERAPNMLPLPVPTPGGSLDKLRAFVNVKSDADFTLVKAYMQAALRPGYPYPILALGGEQGTAKSTGADVLKMLVDPHKLELRSLPHDVADLFIAARSNQVLVYDNLSGLKVWLSDAFCKLSTGGGIGKRALYTDVDEAVLEGMRPVILTAIAPVAVRGDMADRTLPIVLEVIAGDRRKTEEEFWAAFAANHAAILGGLLDTIVTGLRALPTVKLQHLPRMADFAMWGCACDAGRTGADSFIAAYTKNQADAVAIVVGENLVATAVLTFMEGKSEWEGNATLLLDTLNSCVSDTTKKDKDWPKASNALSRRLTLLATVLRKSGVAVTCDHNKRGSLITLRQTAGSDNGPETPSPSAPSSPTADFGGTTGDGLGDDVQQTGNTVTDTVTLEPAEYLDSDDDDGGDDVSGPLSEPWETEL